MNAFTASEDKKSMKHTHNVRGPIFLWESCI